MYVKCSITIGDEETETTATCHYKENEEFERCNIGACIAEAFVKTDYGLSTLAEMMDALLNLLNFDLDNNERARLKRALDALQEKTSKFVLDKTDACT